MKKQLLKSALIAVAGVGLLAGSSMASILELPVASGYNWTTTDYWTVTDITENYSSFKLDFLNGEAAYSSTFGIYAYSTGEKVELFSGSDVEGEEISVWFQWDGSGWEVSTDDQLTFTDFSSVFGFYSDVDTGSQTYTLYTDETLNDDGKEHFAIAFKPLNNAYIYLEDRLNVDIWDNDGDSVDKIIYTTDITPAAVPEPATMLLFGSGIAGLAAVARRRKDTKN